MNIVDYDISHTYKAVVRETARMTPVESEAEVRHIVLDISDTNFHYIEGQSVGVLPPGPHEFGNEHHLRLYSIASGRHGDDRDGSTISLCVRRCFYVDEVNGERYPGVASNYLCDRKVGDKVTITGPYGRHFLVPRDSSSNLLLIAIGTGIAPFRAFVKHIYEDKGTWKGQVRLFHGAMTPFDLLYMNDLKDDLGQYYDKQTFRAFEALSPRPHFDEPPGVDERLKQHSEEVSRLLQDPKTFVYVAGLERLAEKLDNAFVEIAGSEEAWREQKETLVADRRWAELLY